MTGGSSDSTDVTCPVCDSTGVDRVDTVEHEECGYIRPVSEFRTDDGAVCPDCGRENGSFDRVGTISVCSNGHRFDEAAASIRRTAAETTSGEPTTRGSPVRQSTSWIRRVVTVVLVTAIITTGIGGAVFAAPHLQNDDTDGSWETYQSIVVFRNDDTQPYYKSEARSDVYQVFIEENVPLTDAVIPYPGNRSIAGSELCGQLSRLKSSHPDLFEFAVHGYTHSNRQPNFYSGSEFGGLSEQKQRKFLRRAKGAVKQCVGVTPSTFVPPRNTYDNATNRALKATGYETVSGHAWFTERYYNRTDPFVRNDVAHVPATQEFVEDWSPVTFYDRTELKRQFDRAYQNEEIFVQTIHYTMFNTSERVQKLRWLVEYTKSKEDVKFMTVGELGRHFRQNTIKKTEDGWRVYESSNSEYTTTDRIEMMVDGFWGRIAMVGVRPADVVTRVNLGVRV